VPEAEANPPAAGAQASPTAVATLAQTAARTMPATGRWQQGRAPALVGVALALLNPVMAIGAQGHDVDKVPLSTVQTYVADLVSQTGLPVYITELDLPIADDSQQATILKDFVTAFWNDPNVPGITYWGYIVGLTWRSNTGLMTSDGTMRPAMTWLMDFLGR